MQFETIYDCHVQSIYTKSRGWKNETYCCISIESDGAVCSVRKPKLSAEPTTYNLSNVQVPDFWNSLLEKCHSDDYKQLFSTYGLPKFKHNFSNSNGFEHQLLGKFLAIVLSRQQYHD